MKKITVISPFFYPELISTGKYNTELVRELAGSGRQIDVLCSHPLYPDWIPAKSVATLPGVRIHRAGRSLRYPKNLFLRRAVLELWFAIFVLTRWPLLYRSDLIISIVPPSLFLSMISWAFGKKSVSIVHDLQVVHVGESPSRLKKIIAGIITVVEGFGLRSSRLTVFLSEEMRQLSMKLYSVSKSGSQVIYPPVTVSDFSDKGSLSSQLWGDEVNIVYSGALGEKQSPWHLMELAREIVRVGNGYTFNFFSGGPIFEELKDKNTDDRIRFYQLVREDELGELLGKSSVQIIPQAPGTSAGSLPSKLPNVLASGSLLLVITDKGSELEMLLNQQSGVAVETTWDPKTIVLSIQNLLDMRGLDQPEMIRAARAGLLKKFDRKLLIATCLSIIERGG
tara:strand:- start:181 stop:1365 length:1185 start_codon:yes stop_codon:yes gene_type:complete